MIATLAMAIKEKSASRIDTAAQKKLEVSGNNIGRSSDERSINPPKNKWGFVGCMRSVFKIKKIPRHQSDDRSSESTTNQTKTTNSTKNKKGFRVMLTKFFKKKKTLDSDDDEKAEQKSKTLEEKEPNHGFVKGYIGELIRRKWKRYLATAALATALVVSVTGIIFGLIFQPIVVIVIILLNVFAGFCLERYMMYKDRMHQEE